MNGGSEWGNVVEEHVSRQLRKTCRIINFHLCKCCVLVFSRFHTVSHFLLLYFFCSDIASVERILALTQHELLNGLFAGTRKVKPKYATNCDKQTSQEGEEQDRKPSFPSPFSLQFVESSLCARCHPAYLVSEYINQADSLFTV